MHPIAQRWLAKNISSISKSGVQIIISTHSPEFLDIENLEGFVKVYRDENKTKIIQHSAQSLAEECIRLKGSTSINANNILNFYKTKTFYDQLRGFFARRIILVEGQSEFFSLPNYFKNCGYELAKNGVEIINCRGKEQIPRDYRFFKSYQYDCFCLFDADTDSGSNDDFANTFEFDKNGMNFEENSFTYDSSKKYGYFGKNFETYLRNNIPDYSTREASIEGNKIIKAKIVSEQNPEFKPAFIQNIATSLSLESDLVSPDSS